MSEHPTTSNHAYPVPEPGTLDGSWGTVINDELTDQLEVDVEIRAAEADLNTYDPADGALFRATDTGTIYLGDGNAWSKADLSVASAVVEGFTLDGVQFWVSDTEPAGAESDDVWIETNWDS